MRAISRLMTIVAATISSLGTFHLTPSVAAAQVMTEPPERWWSSTVVRATIEVEEERLPDKVIFSYRLRNLSEPTDEIYPAVVKVVVSGPAAVATSLLRSVVTIESPAEWEGQLLEEPSGSAGAWQVSWTCNHKGWDHTLEHQLTPGSVLNGFRVLVSVPNLEYVAAPYAVYLLPNSGRFSGWHRVDGKPFRVKPRHP
jgi:hypothetical protein